MASVSMEQCQPVRVLGGGRFVLGGESLPLALRVFAGACAVGMVALGLVVGPSRLWPPGAGHLLVVLVAGAVAVAAALAGTRLTFDTVAGVVYWLQAGTMGIKRKMLSSSQVCLVLRGRLLLGNGSGGDYMLLVMGEVGDDEVLLARGDDLEEIRSHAERLSDQLQVAFRDFTR